VEARFVAARAYQIEIGEGPRGQFDAAHLKVLHGFLFQDVFEWAGHTRDDLGSRSLDRRAESASHSNGLRRTDSGRVSMRGPGSRPPR
jgi:fido (protein-threonine AMPylation protein)